MTQTILILQGPPSGFAAQLGRVLRDRGHKVHRVNFCTGDWLFWPGGGARHYRGGRDGWAEYLRDLIRREGITDILYYADRLPYHRIAQQVAGELGIRAISYEFGYLRPDWIIVERGGQSARSHFPDDLGAIRAAAAGLETPDVTLRYPYRFATEAFNEVLFNLVNYFLWFLYPRYDTDRPHNPLFEYLSYIPRLVRGRRAAGRAGAEVAALTAGTDPFFVMPLQLQSDYQIRDNSPYPGLDAVIGEVIASFAAHADPKARLVFKLHPLDPGLRNWARAIGREAGAAGIGGRVHFLDGGDLMALMRHCAGVVTVNSTVGLHGLQAGAPVKCLGIAVYDIDGLTFQAPLDRFWRGAQRPDPADVEALVRLMAHAIHVKGNFYSAGGRAAAADAMAARLTEGRINDGAFVDPPPRLARAAAMGILVD